MNVQLYIVTRLLRKKKNGKNNKTITVDIVDDKGTVVDSIHSAVIDFNWNFIQFYGTS